MKARKNENFEVNLLPVISLLAVCISFLLLTTVWIHVGTLNVQQAVGENSDQQSEGKNPSLWLRFDNNSNVFLEARDLPNSSDVSQVFHPNAQNWEQIEEVLADIKTKYPEIKMGFVLPAANSSYQTIIRVIEALKVSGIKNVGIAPLGSET